jgi:hypothetical protein
LGPRQLRAPDELNGRHASLGKRIGKFACPGEIVIDVAEQHDAQLCLRRLGAQSRNRKFAEFHGAVCRLHTVEKLSILGGGGKLLCIENRSRPHLRREND